MKPLDPRLLHYAAPAKRYIIQIAIAGVLVALLVIAQAFLISGAASPVVNYGAPLSQILPLVGWLLLVVTARAVVTYWRESRGHRAADQTIETLRQQVIKKTIALGPRWRATNGTDTTTLVTRGLDDLDPYFVRYLPQLLLVMTVTPATLLTILILDFWSALVAVITVPLIPIFMALIGRMTQSTSRKRLLAMERLGSQLLDLIIGLPTLKALGRERGPRQHLVKLSDQGTKTTMQTLRIAFLSGGVLEFLSTLSVALVAVEVGFRMVFGHIDLFTGLVIIMLAPEVYEPLRQVGAQFHASANGIAAAEECFDILEAPTTPNGTLPAPPSPTIRFDDVFVAARGTWSPASLNGSIAVGSITALAGPSGVGKTTAAMTILGLEAPTKGRVLLGAQQLSETDLNSWWEQISWVPQAPVILPGTIRQNLPDVSIEQLESAAKLTGFSAVVESLPDGWQTPIGAGGLGLSVGQRQRLALTRALVNKPSFLVLDEPTAHLDAISEEAIVAVLEELRNQGTTIVVIAHRQAVLRAADQVITVRSAPASEKDLAEYPQLSAQIVGPDLTVKQQDLFDREMIEEVL